MQVAENTPATVAGPIVKWVGGKSKLLPELCARLPHEIRRYYEPFAGGAALFFATQPSNAVLGDSNEDLIGVYTAVRDDIEGVLERLALHAVMHYREAYYYEVRARWNEGVSRGDIAARAAEFLYLNRTCYNGVWRVNKAGGFNVPKGDYKNPTICNVEALRAASAALQRVDLRAGDYRDTVHDAEAGDLVYFDPPYDATFNGYTSAGTFDQAQLAATVRELHERGVHVMASNSDTPRIRELYAGLRIDIVRCPRAVNSNGAGRGEVNEVVVLV